MAEIVGPGAPLREDGGVQGSAPAGITRPDTARWSFPPSGDHLHASIPWPATTVRDSSPSRDDEREPANSDVSGRQFHSEATS